MSKSSGARNGRITLLDSCDAKSKASPELEVLLNQYAASEPVRVILQKMNISSRDLVKDLLIDASDLLFDLGALDSICGSIYPHTEMSTSSMIRLSTNDATGNDQLIEMLSSSYQNTARTAGSPSPKKWINIINADNSCYPISVADDCDYWNLIRAIRNSYEGSDINFSVRCQQRRKDNKNREEIVDATCEIKSNILRLSTGNRQNERGAPLEIRQFKAISLTLNYPIPTKYLLDIKFSAADWPNKSNLEFSAAVNFGDTGTRHIAKLGATVSLAIQPDQIRAASATLVISNGPSTSDNAIVAEEIFAMHKLLKGNSNNILPMPGNVTNNTPSTPAPVAPISGGGDASIIPLVKIDEPERLDISLREATARRLAKLTIFRATNLICPNGRTPPNPFCAVYLLGPNKERVKMYKKEMVSATCKKTCNPEWNIEMELQGPSGIEGVAYVVIKIKDGGIGKFDYKPLGQVLIPINTFMFGKNDPEVTLPLEPVENMDRSLLNRPLGHIIVHAELVELPTTSGRRLPNDHVQTGSARIECTIRSASATGTWWPCKLLYEKDHALTTGSSLTTGNPVLCHMAAGMDAMLLKLRRPSETFVYKEVLVESPDVLCIPWNQVGVLTRAGLLTCLGWL